MSEATQTARLCEIALKAIMVDQPEGDDEATDTIALTETEWETGNIPTVNWRRYHVDDDPDSIDEPKNYPAVELAFDEPRRIHPHDPTLLQADGQLLVLSHYSRDRKRQVLTELATIIRDRIEDRGLWSIIDLAFPDNIGLHGLQLIPANVELNENLQAQAWTVQLHLVTTTPDTQIATTTL
jgi:hypothetical protein